MAMSKCKNKILHEVTRLINHEFLPVFQLSISYLLFFHFMKSDYLSYLVPIKLLNERLSLKNANVDSEVGQLNLL